MEIDHRLLLFCKGLTATEVEQVMADYPYEKWEQVINHFASIQKRKTRKIGITKLSLKLAKRLKKEFDVDVFPIILRTYAGRNLRSAGAFTWMMLTPLMFPDVGGCSPAKEYIMKGAKLDIWDGMRDIEVMVEQAKEG